MAMSRKGTTAAKKAAEAMTEELATMARLNIAGMWERTKDAFFVSWQEHVREGLTGADLVKAIEGDMYDLSRGPIVDMSTADSTLAYSRGRDMGIKIADAVGRAEFVVRSEVLDTRTCAPCMFLDGEVFDIGTQEYFEYQPPNKCAGGWRCRGFYVAISRDLVAA